MKKLLTLFFFLPIIAYAADFSSFRTARILEENGITRPTVVEISGITSSFGYTVADKDGNAVPIQQRVNRSFIAPTEVSACTSSCIPALALSDNNSDTTFDFPLLNKGMNRGKITIVYAQPLLTNSFYFRATPDSYMPTSFGLTVDGKRVLNSISGDRAVFPQMMAKKIEVEFEYYQTLRFTEVGAGANFEESNKLRFVYQPGQVYTLYTDSANGDAFAPSPDIDLFSKTARTLVPGELVNNPQYKEPDADSDLIPDVRDNCPSITNPDQADGDGNRVGDMCDDYDFDGVATNRDNCPSVANRDQMDTDRDGLGDVCDGAESRITEKYPWMPWIILGIIFLTLGYMGYEVVQSRKETITTTTKEV